MKETRLVADSTWLRRFKNALRPLINTPLHPQWLGRRGTAAVHAWLRAVKPGATVLDLGCADRWPRRHLPATCIYYGIDHPETSAGYGTRPSVYADAHAIPCRSESADAVLMLDVLEHLRDPEKALAEVRRILVPGGTLILQVPFLYPLHDAPNDHTRWTAFGQRSLAERTGFEVLEEQYAGEPIVTAGLLANIALSHSVLTGLRHARPGALLLPVLPLIVLTINVAAWLLSRVFERSSLMPFAYQAVWKKTAADPAL